MAQPAVDAGTKIGDHYAKYMSPGRFWLRSQILKVVRAETDVLAQIQRAVRCPILDSYFALSANIGTHTFYMVMLPGFFWYSSFYMGFLVIMVLAVGVFTTGFVKDLLCLPRPRSPPLHRISMSASAKLEYGLPSTHSCNAVSVAMVFRRFDPNSRLVFWLSAWLLLTLISGRVYTGMHGPLDIAVGCVIGAYSYWLSLGIDHLFDFHKVLPNLILTVGFVLAISLCPSPVDNCPCFDDSVAFSGVVLGMTWSLVFVDPPMPFHEKFSGSNLGSGALAFRGVLRFVIGVIMIVTWRSVSKRVLLRLLPPIWRVLDRCGLRNPRRFFVPVPANQHLTPKAVADGILDASPQKFMQDLSHRPKDSVGPQSEADLYEIKERQSERQRKHLPIRTDEVEPNGTKIQHFRQHYDFEVFMRLIVYAGIGPMTLYLAPAVFEWMNV